MLQFVFTLNIRLLKLIDKQTFPIIVKNIWSLPQ